MVANQQDLKMLGTGNRAAQHKTSACKIAVLLEANNSNQAEWVSAVKSYAMTKRGLPLLMKIWNTSRAINMGDLMNSMPIDLTGSTKAKDENGEGPPKQFARERQGREHPEQWPGRQ